MLGAFIDGGRWLVGLVCCGHGRPHHKIHINFYFIVYILYFLNLVHIYIYIWISSFQLHVSCDLGMFISSWRVCDISYSQHLCRVYCNCYCMLMPSGCVSYCLSAHFCVQNLEVEHLCAHFIAYFRFCWCCCCSLPSKFLDFGMHYICILYF